MSLSKGHWSFEEFKQRVNRKEWQKILLEHGDQIIARGKLRQLKAKNLGAGVYEIHKVPLKG